MCQYNQNLIINEELPICFNCSEFINDLNVNSLIATFIIHFHDTCQTEFLNIFGAQTTIMCNIVAEFLRKSLDSIRMKFFDSNEICKLLNFNNCTLELSQIENDKCNKCKAMASQFKIKIQDIQLNEYTVKYLPYLTNFLLLLCTDLSIDCKQMNVQQVIQDLISSQMDYNEFSSKLCSLIDMCEA